MGLSLGELAPSILCPTSLACAQQTNIMILSSRWGLICRILLTMLAFLMSSGQCIPLRYVSSRNGEEVKRGFDSEVCVIRSNRRFMPIASKQ